MLGRAFETFRRPRIATLIIGQPMATGPAKQDSNAPRERSARRVRLVKSLWMPEDAKFLVPKACASTFGMELESAGTTREAWSKMFASTRRSIRN